MAASTDSPSAAPTLANPPRPSRIPPWLLLVLAGVCFFMRAINLMNLPVFGDEAIYLRWAQLIRGQGVDHPYGWVSLADPKPPLHFWLLALVFNTTHDPLLAARLLSVLAGVASLILLILTCAELGHLIRPRRANALPTPTSAILGLLAATLFIFCPFLSFYQRLATADALFLGESLLIVWLALKWGRTVTTSPTAWYTAAALGLALGAALLTRQGLSYILFAFPIIAALIRILRRHPASRPPRRSTATTLAIALLQLLITSLIAAALWSSYLLAELPERALIMRRETPNQIGPANHTPLTTADLLTEIKRRILYQDSFTSNDHRAALITHNTLLTFIPTWSTPNTTGGRATSWLPLGKPGEAPETGWYPLYLTPAIYLTSLLALLYLALRRQGWLLGFLLLWLALMLGPVILLGNVIYSRYTLAGIPPLLIAAAFLLADLFALLLTKPRGRAPRALAWSAITLLCAALILPALRQIGLQSSRWWDQYLTRHDRYQYITGWDAGSATMKALAELEGLSRVGPLIIITNDAWGLPADAAWLYLSRLPNIHLYYTDNLQPVLSPATGAHTYSLRNDKWTFQPSAPTTLPEHIPILFLTNDPIHGPEQPAAAFLKDKNPNLTLVATFYGIDNPGEDRVQIFAANMEPK